MTESNTEQVIAALDAIEQEMRQIGFWSDDPPDLQTDVAAGRIRSFLDAPSFELWLQCIFLPNARKAVESANYPSESQVGEMARRQYDFHGDVPQAARLVELLQRFDDLIDACT